MKTYALLGPHTHDGRQLKAGDPVTLTDPQAAWLHGLGLVALNGVTPSPREVPALLRKPLVPRCRPCGY